VTAREWGSIFREASRVKQGAEAPRLPPAPGLPPAPAASQADFGTTLTGEHTAHELSDLLSAKQSEIDDVTSHVHTLPASSDPTWKAWSSDWARFLSDWSSAASSAHAFIQSVKDNPTLASAASLFSSPVAWLTQKDPLDQVTAEPYYQSILSVLQPGGAGTSRLQDLYSRYNALPKATPIVFRKVPQPSAPDESLNVYNSLPNVPANPLSLWKKVPWWAWAGGGVVVLGAGVTVLKASPLGMALRVLR
jgi:hypothetical protein